MSAAKPSHHDPEPSAERRSVTTGAASPGAVEGRLDDGDISLIRSMLECTPTERLERLQDFADGVTALRDGRVDR